MGNVKKDIFLGLSSLLLINLNTNCVPKHILVERKTAEEVQEANIDPLYPRLILDMSDSARSEFLNDNEVVGAYHGIDFFGLNSITGRDHYRLLERKAYFYIAKYPLADTLRTSNFKVSGQKETIEVKVQELK
ncbi:hypothetical protein J4471_00860 [Candidatus Woesearchaeota archaeon]|nr:hypothetical protein [Candidatus Woesearchaeota archaeon]